MPRWFLTDIVAPWALTRLALTAIGLAALGSLPLEPSRVGWLTTGQPLLDMWSRWDGDWYASIVARGYFFAEGTVPSIAFAPAYPALVRLAASFTADDHAGRVIAGLIVSNVALIFGLVYMWLLVREDGGAEVAARSVRYLLIFPMSLFLSAMYAESLYLAFALGALYHARRGQWRASALLAAGTAVTRPFGILIVVGLGIELVLQRRTRWRDAFSLAIPIAAFASWMVATWILTGRPTGYIEAVGGWGRHLVPPWEELDRVTAARYMPFGGGGAESYADLLLIAMIVLLVIRSWRLVRPSAAAWASVVLALLVSTGTFVSVPRYALGLYPAFVALAGLGSRALVERAYVVLAAVGSAVLMMRFALWYWVA